MGFEENEDPIMGIFRKKKAADAGKYAGALRPPPSGSHTASVVSPYNVRRDAPQDYVALTHSARVTGTEQYLVVVIVSRVQQNASDWWDNFLASWIDEGRTFEFVDGVDHDEEYYFVKDDAIVLFTDSQNDMMRLEQVINKAAGMRRAAYTHEVEMRK